MCNEAAARAQYDALLRWFHTYLTVDGYRDHQISGEALVAENVRSLKVVLTKGMFAYFKEVRTCLGGFRED
jgi:hypothetical protein